MISSSTNALLFPRSIDPINVSAYALKPFHCYITAWFLEKQCCVSRVEPTLCYAVWPCCITNWWFVTGSNGNGGRVQQIHYLHHFYIDFASLQCRNPSWLHKRLLNLIQWILQMPFDLSEMIFLLSVMMSLMMFKFCKFFFFYTLQVSQLSLYRSTWPSLSANLWFRHLLHGLSLYCL